MSVQSEIDRINNNIANTYSVLEGAGADMPQSRNANNLAETAASIKAVLYGKEQSLTEFQKALARQNIGVLEPLIGSTANITPSQVSAALLKGRDVVLSYTDETYGVIHFSGFMEVPALGVVISSGAIYVNGAIMRFEIMGDKTDNEWWFDYGELAKKEDIPTGNETVPNYVVTEAMGVLDKVVSAQGSRTFVLGAITDMHYGSSDYTDGVVHACQGMKHISERIKLDAIAVLGDYTDEHQMDTETAVTDLEEMNALLDRFCDIVNLRVKGNHDHRPGAAAQTYRYIFAHNDDVVWGSRIGGYFYRDFTAYKLRVICLNTTEVARDNISVSDEQYNFFVNALDMSAKDDAEEWGILMLSHHPLDWTVTSGAYRFGHILNAYQTGSSWTDGTISCNFADKNPAKIVGNIHGHIHNLLTDKIYVGEPGNSAQTSVWRMAVPASRVDVPNHYSGIWQENATYSKTKNTAEDTAFNIVCIDLDAHTMKAFCYGAGYDRELTYYEEKKPLVNLIDTVGYTDNTRYSASSHGGKTADGYVLTGAIQLSAGDVLRTSGVNFDAADYNYGNIACIPNASPTSDWTLVTNSTIPQNTDKNYLLWELDDANNLTITGGANAADIKIRLTGYGSGANLIVTKNQEIT